MNKKKSGNQSIFIHQPHDKLFKESFTEDVIEEFLKNHLDEALLNDLDLTKIQRISSGFQTYAHQHHIADLVFKVALQENVEKAVFFVLEHQSRPDRNMPLRMQRYANELMAAHAYDDGTLPFVVSMVLYTGNQEYSYANSLRDQLYAPNYWKQKYPLHRFQLICSQNVLHKVEGVKYPLILSTYSSGHQNDLGHFNSLLRDLDKKIVNLAMNLLKLSWIMCLIQTLDDSESIFLLGCRLCWRKSMEKVRCTRTRLKM